MSTAATTTPKEDPMLEFIWGQYRTWALTSRKLKNLLESWKTRVFILGVVGSLAAVLSDQVVGWGAPQWAAQVCGVAAGLAVALAAYAGSEILTQQSEQNWLRSRATAEAFKREAYLYVLGAPPYDNPAGFRKLFTRTEELLSQVSDIPAASITPEDAKKRMPKLDLTIPQYVKQRLSDQVHDYYRPKAAEYLRILGRGKKVSWVLGFAGVVLGTGAASCNPSSALWIAFISATTAAIATFLSTNRYEHLALSYQVTANRLQMLSARYHQLDQASKEEELKFVQEVEDTIAIENSAWVVELTQAQEEGQEQRAEERKNLEEGK